MAVMTRQPADWTDRAPLKVELCKMRYPQRCGACCAITNVAGVVQALEKAEATGGPASDRPAPSG